VTRDGDDGSTQVERAPRPARPRPTDHGAPSPWREVFDALCRQAAQRDPPITRKALAVDAGIRSKDMTRYSSDAGTGQSWSREPPAWIVRRIAERLGLAIVLLPDEVLLVPIETARALVSP